MLNSSRRLPLPQNSAVSSERTLKLLQNSSRYQSLRAVLNATMGSDAWYSVSDLAYLTGLSRPTVSQCANVLTQANIIRVKTSQLGHQSGGPKPKVYGINRNHHSTLILRANYRWCEGYLVDASGTITETCQMPYNDFSEVVDSFRQCALNMATKASSPIMCVTFIVMGIVCDNRVVRSERFKALNKPGWIETIFAALNGKVAQNNYLVLNDAKTAALWMNETAVAALPQPECLIALHCSEEFGCGIVVEGRLLEGAHGAAGEILMGKENSWLPASSLLRSAEKEHGKNIREIFADIAENPELFEDFTTELANAISTSLAPLILVTDPAIVVLGGAICNAGEVLPDKISRGLLNFTSTPPEVLLSPKSVSPVLQGALLQTNRHLEEQILESLVFRS